MGLNQPVLQEKPSYIPTDIPTRVTKILEICPVCGAKVDPENSKFNIAIGGHYFYFDRQSCMEAFAKDPLKYSGARLKFKIKIEPNPQAPETITTPSPTATEYIAEPTPEKTVKTPEPTPTETEELPIEEFPLEDETPK
jgi:YHS domain-containing protein